MNQKFKVVMNQPKNVLKRYFRVFGVANCDFLVRIRKFKMADLKCRVIINFAVNLSSWIFEVLITDLKPELKNSRRRIRYNGSKI